MKFRNILSAALLCVILAVPAWGQGGVVLMGIDAEGGGVGGHGPVDVYADVVNFLGDRCVSRQQEDILVLGGDKSFGDEVTRFWREIESESGRSVTFVNGTEIATKSLQDFGIIAVVSMHDEVVGGLTQAEHDAVVARQADIASFISSGGGLIGMYSGFSNPFGYLGGVGAITTQAANYDQVDPTPEPNNPIPAGFTLGSGNFWHQTFETFPSFLHVLANSRGTDRPAVIGGCQVTVPSPCADVVGDEPLCTTDGSGDFTYTFTVTNNTEEEIHHLFLVEPTPGVEITPDYFDATDLTGQPGKPLCSPEDSTCDIDRGENTSKPLTVRIKNAQPEDVVSFLVTIHDELIDECCSVEHAVELPPCDCGQIVDDRAFCSFRLFPFSTRHKYNFTFQNLLPDGVENILIAPSQGSDVTVTPNRFSGVGLTGVPYVDDSGEHAATLTLTGPDAKQGEEVCLRISSHNDDFQECCSIERCFTLGRCFFLFDDFTLLGDATSTLVDGGLLRLEGFDSEGDDGARFGLGRADKFELGFLSFDETEVLEGAFVELAAFEPADVGEQQVAALRLEETGQELQLLASSISGPARSLTIRRNGLEVAQVALDPGSNVGLPDDVWKNGANDVPSTTITVEITVTVTVTATSIEIEIEIVVKVESDTVIDTGDGGSVLGDELVFTFDPTERVPSLGSARFLAAGIEGITLTEARGTLTDCNGNGVSDAVDIAQGTSADENRDGVPDECQVRAPDLEVKLDTGFDEAADRFIPPREADDDWRILVDGARLPARRVDRVDLGWNPPLPGSAWISLEGRKGQSIPGLDVFRYERCFCIGDEAQAAGLDLELFADDSATVFFNGSLIGGPGGRFNAPEPLSVHFDGLVGQSLFQRGRNCLVVEVEDGGGVVTGLDLVGSVVAEEGACVTP